jgi:hypothetical protein
VQQIATGMPGKPRLLVELKTENARTLVQGSGRHWTTDQLLEGRGSHNLQK